MVKGIPLFFLEKTRKYLIGRALTSKQRIQMGLDLESSGSYAEFYDCTNLVYRQ
jgi:hypothetical protein